MCTAAISLQIVSETSENCTEKEIQASAHFIHQNRLVQFLFTLLRGETITGKRLNVAEAARPWLQHMESQQCAILNAWTYLSLIAHVLTLRHDRQLITCGLATTRPSHCKNKKPWCDLDQSFGSSHKSNCKLKNHLWQVMKMNESSVLALWLNLEYKTVLISTLIN